jgi:peptide/nickel transport system permease protein
MSRGNFDAPVLAPEGPSEVGEEQWVYVSTRRTGRFAKWKNPIGIAGAIIVGFNVLVAIFGRFVWTTDPNNLVGLRLEDPSWAHPAGTDELGRDTLARIVHGSQVSLQVGLISVSIALVLGLSIGLISGFFSGKVDTLLMRVIDLMFALPGLVLAIVIAGLLGPSRQNAMIAIGIIITPAFARVVRGAVLEVMGFPFVESARALGSSHLRVMARHVLPNIAAPVIVLVTVYLSTAILSEAALSFLGLGTQPPNPSWGNIIRDGLNNLFGSPWPIIGAGFAITCVVLAFNLFGDAVRDALDPETAS